MERFDKLESIGFLWDGRGPSQRKLDSQWNAMFDQLVRYKSDNGDFCVPYEVDRKLAGWILRQRKQFKLGKMPKSRIDKLDAIGFNWRR